MNISFNKIKLLITKFFVEYWKREVLMWLIIFLLAGFIGYFPSITFVFIPFFYIYIVTVSPLFDPIKSNSSRINFLMVPASTGDKVVSNVLLTYIYQLIVLTIVLFLGIHAGRLIDSLAHDHAFSLLAFPDLHLVPSSMHIFLILSILLLQAIFVFGSLYFKKNTRVKTALCGIGFFLFSGFLDMFISRKFVNITALRSNFADINSSNPAINIIVAHNVPFRFDQFDTIFIILQIILILVFWLLTFFKLRETEV